MENQEGYCMKCRSKKLIVNPEKITMKNGKLALTGKCPSCEGKIFKFLKQKPVEPKENAPANN